MLLSLLLLLRILSCVFYLSSLTSSFQLVLVASRALYHFRVMLATKVKRKALIQKQNIYQDKCLPCGKKSRQSPTKMSMYRRLTAAVEFYFHWHFSSSTWFSGFTSLLTRPANNCEKQIANTSLVATCSRLILHLAQGHRRDWDLTWRFRSLGWTESNKIGDSWNCWFACCNLQNETFLHYYYIPRDDMLRLSYKFL